MLTLPICIVHCAAQRLQLAFAYFCLVNCIFPASPVVAGVRAEEPASRGKGAAGEAEH
jgi:hypothetical protein